MDSQIPSDSVGIKNWTFGCPPSPSHLLFGSKITPCFEMKFWAHLIIKFPIILYDSLSINQPFPDSDKKVTIFSGSRSIIISTYFLKTTPVRFRPRCTEKSSLKKSKRTSISSWLEIFSISVSKYSTARETPFGMLKAIKSGSDFNTWSANLFSELNFCWKFGLTVFEKTVFQVLEIP